MAKSKEEPDGDQETFGLREMLEALHDDLHHVNSAFGEDGVLAVSQVEVEVSFTIAKTREGGGGLGIRVFGIGAGAHGSVGSNRESVHRMTLRLSPADGKPPFLVAGTKGDQEK